jgi:hypothetical protein
MQLAIDPDAAEGSEKQRQADNLPRNRNECGALECGALDQVSSWQQPHFQFPSLVSGGGAGIFLPRGLVRAFFCGGKDQEWGGSRCTIVDSGLTYLVRTWIPKAFS